MFLLLRVGLSSCRLRGAVRPLSRCFDLVFFFLSFFWGTRTYYSVFFVLVQRSCLRLGVKREGSFCFFGESNGGTCCCFCCCCCFAQPEH